MTTINQRKNCDFPAQLQLLLLQSLFLLLLLQVVLQMLMLLLTISILLLIIPLLLYLSKRHDEPQAQLGKLSHWLISYSLLQITPINLSSSSSYNPPKYPTNYLHYILCYIIYYDSLPKACKSKLKTRTLQLRKAIYFFRLTFPGFLRQKMGLTSTGDAQELHVYTCYTTRGHTSTIEHHRIKIKI